MSQASSSPRAAFLHAARTVLPVLLGAAPFGLVVGIVSAENALTATQTFIQTSGIFAGASQLLLLNLYGEQAALWVIVLSTGILNLRHVIYSASLAPHYKTRSTAWKLLLSFVMVDQVYALSQAHINDNPTENHLHWYHMGLAIPILIVWTVSTMFGYLVGSVIPPEWGLTFIIPVMFLALLVPAIKGFPYLAAALVSTVVALLTVNLPNNLGMMLATLLAIATGVLLDHRQEVSQ